MKKRLIQDQIMKQIFRLAGVFSVLVLIGIIILLFTNAIRAFKHIPFSSFFNISWNPSAYGEPSYGMLQLLWSSLLVSIGAMAIAIPLGIGAAAYLSEVAPERVRKIVRPIIEILAGIPSVTIGFIGIVLIGPFLARCSVGCANFFQRRLICFGCFKMDNSSKSSNACCRFRNYSCLYFRIW